jgi:adenylate cyclase
MSTRQISAKQLVHDIRAGIDDAGLMLKYGVTPPQLRALLKKLVQMGALAQPEIDFRVPLKRDTEAPVAKELPEIHATQLLQPESVEALQSVKVEPPVAAEPQPKPSSEREPEPERVKEEEPPEPPPLPAPREPEEIRAPKERRKAAHGTRAGWFLNAATGVVWCLIALALIYYYPEVPETLNLKIYDLKLSRVPPPAYHRSIVHLDVDDEAIMKFGPWPWDRGLSARIVDKLAEFGASIVAFDILYCSPGKSPEGNQALCESMKKAGNVIAATGLGISYDRTQELKLDQNSTRADALYDKSWKVQLPATAVLPRVVRLKDSYVPLPGIIVDAQEVGHVKVSPDRDGVHRRMPVLVKLEERYVPCLSLAVLKAIWKLDPQRLNVTDAGELVFDAGFQRRRIPLDSKGLMLVRWGEPWESFPHYSVVDLLAEKPDPSRKSRYANKIVIVGFTATGNTDVGVTPVSVETPLSRIHSHMLNTILNEAFIVQIPAVPWILGGAVLLTIIFSVIAARVRWRIGALVAVLICVLALAAVAACFVFQAWEVPLAEAFIIFVPAAVMSLMVRAVSIELRAARAARVMERYLNPKLLTKLLEGGKELDIAAKRKELTVVVAHIVGFATVAETVTAEYVHGFLSDFFEAMAQAVFEHEGTIDKFLGDGLQAFFGEPIALENHAESAVLGAMEMQREMFKEEKRYAGTGIMEFPIGIGISIRIQSPPIVRILPLQALWCG